MQKYVVNKSKRQCFEIIKKVKQGQEWSGWLAYASRMLLCIFTVTSCYSFPLYDYDVNQK